MGLSWTSRILCLELLVLQSNHEGGAFPIRTPRYQDDALGASPSDSDDVPGPCRMPGGARFTDWAEHLSASNDQGRTYKAITLHVVYGSDWNLLDPAIQACWSQHLWEGRIADVMVAPPCETWFRARCCQSQAT